ncbi:hypothetical protein D3C71_2203260 [compost metagenome]
MAENILDRRLRSLYKPRDKGQAYLSIMSDQSPDLVIRQIPGVRANLTGIGMGSHEGPFRKLRQFPETLLA